MKKQFLKYLSFAFLSLFFFSCQNLERPELGDYPLDAPVITFVTPNPAGSTVIQSIQPTTSMTVKFNVTDDIGLTDIVVQYNGATISSMSGFSDPKNVVVDDLLVDNIPNGNHEISISATDTDGNTSSQTVPFLKKQADPYNPLYAGEVFYMPFEGNFYDYVTATPATETGTPGFAGIGAEGTTNSFIAGTNNYLTFPTTGLKSAEYSAAFWYQVNNNPDRAGILVVGKTANDRFQGFRLFRENSNGKQRIKLNVGTGSGESWNDGGELVANTGEWVHVAFTISATQTKIYFNGELMNTASTNGIDWTGANEMTIGAGGSTFSYWNHLSDSSKMDELRIFNKALSQFEVQTIAGTAYTPFSGETLYMPFDGKYNDRVSNNMATSVGTPAFLGSGYAGNNAYKGATDSYLNYPLAGLFGGSAFSVSFYYKVNASPDRAGIVTVGNPNVAEDRSKGFRIFREGNATEQRIKLNLGIGGGESWNDGGVITVANGNWVHVVVTVSPTESKIYFDGVLKTTSTFTAQVDWTNCSMVNIGAGGPTFSYWNHLSDLSGLDELRFFNKTLTQSEIDALP